MNNKTTNTYNIHIYPNSSDDSTQSKGTTYSLEDLSENEFKQLKNLRINTDGKGSIVFNWNHVDESDRAFFSPKNDDKISKPESSTPVVLKDTSIPAIPTGLKITNTSSGTVILSWDEVEGATSYKVHQQEGVTRSTPHPDVTYYDATETLIKITRLESNSNIVNLSSDRVEETGYVVYPTKYYFKVKAVIGNEEGEFSNWISVCPTE